MEFLPALNGTYKELPEVYVLPESFAMDESFPEANQIFIERLNRLGNYELDTTKEKVIIYEEQKSLPEEGYRIRVGDEKVVISAFGETGYFYGLTTLFQMFVRGKGTVHHCILSDEPRFERRGTMLDVCRHFFCVEEVKKIIEQISLLKMNQFHWHLSEDQGFRVESTCFPQLNQISAFRKLSKEDPVVQRGLAEAGDVYGGYYTKEEIREVVAYAGARQVEVIPEIDLPGHTSAILAAFPQFTCTGEPLKVKNTFGIHERIFCAGKEGAYEFLYQLLDELCELFPSRYIHLGGDEAPKAVWHKCPACNRLMEEKGIESYEHLQTYFTDRLARHVKKRGKKAVVWNEAAFAGDLDTDAVVQYWAEMAPGPSYMEPELKKGRRLILSSTNQLYCDSYAGTPLRATLMYEPEVKGIKVPIENVLGIEMAMWTEWTPENLDIEQMMYPRLLAVSECGWTKQRNYADFERRAKGYLDAAPLNVLTPMPWEEATIHGEEALRIIAGNMVELGQKYRSMSSGDEEEEAGKAEAVLPDGVELLDRELMTRMFIENKMKAAYTQQEINQVLQMISDVMGK